MSSRRGILPSPSYSRPVLVRSLRFRGPFFVGRSGHGGTTLLMTGTSTRGASGKSVFTPIFPVIRPTASVAVNRTRTCRAVRLLRALSP